MNLYEYMAVVAVVGTKLPEMLVIEPDGLDYIADFEAEYAGQIFNAKKESSLLGAEGLEVVNVSAARRRTIRARFWE